jgi:hypothetical protein
MQPQFTPHSGAPHPERGPNVVLRRSNRLRAAVVGLLCALTVPGLQAEAGDCRATSAARTNVLVELFTSEGCDSCPPADRWMSALAAGSAMPEVVPIAWHVDYWDYLGWKDRFAQSVFSDRQHRLAQIRRERVVYTPQVLVQGRDFRGWAQGGFDAAVARIESRPARARIALEITGRTGGLVDAQVSAELLGDVVRDDPADYGLVLAAVASGFTTQVRRGENAGRTLAHDHVAFGSVGPIPFGPDGRLVRHERLALPAGAPGGSGVAAFVQSARTAEVLQALMLSECRG